ICHGFTPMHFAQQHLSLERSRYRNLGVNFPHPLQTSVGLGTPSTLLVPNSTFTGNLFVSSLAPYLTRKSYTFSVALALALIPNPTLIKNLLKAEILHY